MKRAKQLRTWAYLDSEECPKCGQAMSIKLTLHFEGGDLIASVGDEKLCIDCDEPTWPSKKRLEQFVSSFGAVDAVAIAEDCVGDLKRLIKTLKTGVEEI